MDEAAEERVEVDMNKVVCLDADLTMIEIQGKKVELRVYLGVVVALMCKYW